MASVTPLWPTLSVSTAIWPIITLPSPDGSFVGASVGSSVGSSDGSTVGVGVTFGLAAMENSSVNSIFCSFISSSPPS